MLKLFCPFFLFFSLTIQSQVIVRDSAKIFSIYYKQDVEPSGSIYFYIEYGNVIYNINYYIKDHNAGCVKPELVSINDDCTYKMMKKIIKGKAILLPKPHKKEIVAWKCYQVDIVFFKLKCDLIIPEFDPLVELSKVDETIHIISIISTKLDRKNLPEKVSDFLSHTNR